MTQNCGVSSVAARNDEFRRRGHGGHVVISDGIRAQGSLFITMARAAVQADTAFDKERDVTGHHDFGVVEVTGVRVGWRIEYCQPEHLATPDYLVPLGLTHRVITLFLPFEC